MTAALKNVVVVGYPKSENTWITRLTTELLNCPVTGFWQEAQHQEIACEGQDRPSPIQCFKAHHTLDELKLDVTARENKVIYVVRDPRDVAVSEAHFFKFNKFPKIQRSLENLPLGRAIYNKIVYQAFHSEQYKLEKMIETILDGNKNLSWCHRSWESHYKSYLDSPALFVRYEDMLAVPVEHSKKILKHLNQDRDLDFIKKAVARQSL